MNGTKSPSDESISDLYPPSIFNAWPGIVLSGGLFPVVVVFFTVLSVVVGGHLGQTESLGTLITLLLVCFLLGLIYAAFCAPLAAVLLEVFQLLTECPLSVRGACGVFGGLTGFLCTTWGSRAR